MVKLAPETLLSFTPFRVSFSVSFQHISLLYCLERC